LPTRYGGYSCLLGPEGQPGRDIALLTVELETDYPSRAYLDKISAFPKVNVASMFEVFNDSPTRRLVGAGYGATEQGLPGDARAAVIPIASYFCGGGAYSASTCSSFREFVLADRAAPLGANRSDSCGGDSGAPVFWQAPPASIDGKIGANPNRPIMLVGITSRAVAGVRHNAGTTCGGGGIYTALGHPEVIQWLRANGIPTRNALDYSVQGRPAP
jgi:hypothetical protein